MKHSHLFYVNATGPRPDFRLVLTFVWGDGVDFDTDGNSSNPASHDWTELYAQNRSKLSEEFDISPVGQDSLLLEVESRQEWLAAVVAYMLAVVTKGEVSGKPDGPFGSPEDLLFFVGDFHRAAAWDRFKASPFQLATEEDPYPNLRVQESPPSHESLGKVMAGCPCSESNSMVR